MTEQRRKAAQPRNKNEHHAFALIERNSLSQFSIFHNINTNQKYISTSTSTCAQRARTLIDSLKQ